MPRNKTRPRAVVVVHPLRLLMLVGVLLSALPSICHAQMTTAITSDGTLGTAVTQAGNIHNITGGSRPGEGLNLFHSFDQFSVGTGDIGNFMNDSGLPTSNILSRVTGGDSSQIFGRIQTTDFDNANLFLVNPAGIIFGSTAKLNMSGSFHTTTADFLRLEDGGIFYADLGKESVLTMAPPEAFGFLNENPIGISLDQSSLEVPEGETLSFIGGDVTIVGNSNQVPNNEVIPSLAVEAGRVNLVSVTSPGEVAINNMGQTPNIRVDSFESLGDISLSDRALIDTSGDGGGTVMIRGGRLMMEESRIFANTTGPKTQVATSDGSLEAGIDIQINEDMLLDTSSLIEANVISGSTDGGDISLKVGRNLEVRNGGQISTFVLTGSGNAGDIEIHADNVLLSGTPDPLTGVTSQTNPSFAARKVVQPGEVELPINDLSVTGTSGDIRITANRLEMSTAFISSGTRGVGQGGNIEIAVVEQGDILVSGPGELTGQLFGIFSNTLGNGDGGDLLMTANNLKLSDLASLQAGTFGVKSSGNAGRMAVTLTGNLVMEKNAFIQVASGVTEQVKREGTDTLGGNAGDLILTAKDIVITGRTTGPFPTLLSAATRAGKGGSITIIADSLQVIDGGLITSRALASGEGGSINAMVESLTLSDGSSISAASASTGSAGNVILNVNDLTANSGSEISSSSTSEGSDAGSGGTIDVAATNSVTLTDTTISTSVAGGSKSGGDIILKAGQDVLLSGDTTISAESFGMGNAGIIHIEAGETIQVDTSNVTTQSAIASGGDISLEAVNLIRLRDSTIESSVQGNQTTSGGDINIDPQFVVLQNSNILATAREGLGGNIQITGGQILRDPFTTIDASSQTGISGTVNIRGPIQNLSETIALLPEEILKVSALFAARCAAQKGGNFSSFVPGGFGGAPPGFSGHLPSPLTFLDANFQVSSTTASRVGFVDKQEETKWEFFQTSQTTDFSHDCATVFASPS